MPSVDRRRVCLGRKPNKGRKERKMIYLMPIDECPHCGARTPRVENHRCPKVEQNGRFGDKLAAEHQRKRRSHQLLSGLVDFAGS